MVAQVPVEIMDDVQVFGREQFEKKCGCLRKVTEDIFDLGMEAIIFRTVFHADSFSRALVGTTKVYSGTGADIVMESLHSPSD